MLFPLSGKDGSAKRKAKNAHRKAKEQAYREYRVRFLTIFVQNREGLRAVVMPMLS